MPLVCRQKQCFVGEEPVKFNMFIKLKYTAIYSKPAVAQWLRYCATNWKVAGSIPDGVIGFFH
jgi:hypothetical protein